MANLSSLLGFFLLPNPKLQVPLLLVAVAVVVGWVMYRRKQM